MFNLSPRLAALGAGFFSYTRATALSQAQLVHVNRELISQLKLEAVDDASLKDIISGQQAVQGYSSLAMVYAGHQFGHFVPQLGDGRALLIAEHMVADQVWELQLKGAGKTPYSRSGDGRAVLRSSIREYLASQALAKLNIPTTLAVAMVHSQDPVYREQLETAAIVLRVAPSFIRFGNFEFFAKRQQAAELAQLTQFVCRNYYPEINLDAADYVVQFLDSVIKRTAATIAGWQSVGFVHGVMNSDNMSILGLTIDYGPFAFMEAFNPEQIFNHSDSDGRYVYAQQVDSAWWNLYRLAEALVILYPDTDLFEHTLTKFADYYNTEYQQLMAAKLGLLRFEAGDGGLLTELLELLQRYAIDWTFFWRNLSFGEQGIALIKASYPDAAFDTWLAKLALRYQGQELDELERNRAMQLANPALILRTHLLQQAINLAEQGDYSEVSRLFTALAIPFREQAEFADYYRLPPKWSQSIILSCSS